MCSNGVVFEWCGVRMVWCSVAEITPISVILSSDNVDTVLEC